MMVTLEFIGDQSSDSELGKVSSQSASARARWIILFFDLGCEPSARPRFQNKTVLSLMQAQHVAERRLLGAP